jgi:hypothetical protein
MSIRRATSISHGVCKRLVPDGRFRVRTQRLRHVLLDFYSVSVSELENLLTKITSIILEVVVEMISFPRRLVVELYIHDMIRVLISHFNHTDRIVGWNTSWPPVTKQKVELT